MKAGAKLMTPKYDDYRTIRNILKMVFNWIIILFAAFWRWLLSGLLSCSRCFQDDFYSNYYLIHGVLKMIFI